MINWIFKKLGYIPIKDVDKFFDENDVYVCPKGKLKRVFKLNGY